MRAKTFFKGGIHIPSYKLTAQVPIQRLKDPKRVVIPLSQHTGKPAKLIVNKNDLVTEGQMIGEQDGVISASVHSSINGRVKDIIEHPVPILPRVQSVVIEESPEVQKDSSSVSRKDWRTLNREEILSIIRNSGIVGMGGAAFPTVVKFSPPQNKKITDLIINGVECEPYLTSDHRIMLEYPHEIIEGVEIVSHLLGVKNIFIGIENNKKDAISLLSDKVKGKNIAVCALKEKYPQGGEKQLIFALTGRIVPSGGLPMDVGCVVSNIGTVLAIKRAVVDGKPLIERVVTVTGSIVKRPGNYIVKVGTLLTDLLEQIGGLTEEPGKIIFGGPMTGVSVDQTDIPILKATSGVLFLSRKEALLADYREFFPCIRCGSCVLACPMSLNPSGLSVLGENERWDEMKSLDVLDCIECGCCSYVCPAKRPIVQFVKIAKSKLRRIV